MTTSTGRSYLAGVSSLYSLLPLGLRLIFSIRLLIVARSYQASGKAFLQSNGIRGAFH